MLLSGNDNHIAGMGIQSNQMAGFGYEGRLTNRIVTIPALLKANGYHTYMAGKWPLNKGYCAGGRFTMRDRCLRWCVAFLVVSVLALGGCGYRYYIPEVGMLSTSPELTSGESKALKELQPTFNATGLEPFEVPPPDPNVQMPQVGDKARVSRNPTYSSKFRTISSIWSMPRIILRPP